MNRFLGNQFLLDANILIDFLNTGNFGVLGQFSKKVAAMTILDVIVGEIEELDELMVCESGMLYQTTDEEIINRSLSLAASDPALSFQDHCLFETARDKAYGLITGERKLITKAKEQNITILRGFRLIYHLCAESYLTKDDGLSIVKQIVAYNPYFNNTHVVDFLDLF
jgi:hypothetical protein